MSRNNNMTIAAIRGETYRSIAEKYKLSHERIRQIAMTVLCRAARKHKVIFTRNIHDVRQESEKWIYMIDNDPPFTIEEDTDIESLPFSIRAHNCLSNAGIKTMGQLLASSPRDILKTKNFGKKTLNEITAFLKEHGLFLRSEEPEACPLEEARHMSLGEYITIAAITGETYRSIAERYDISVGEVANITRKVLRDVARKYGDMSRLESIHVIRQEPKRWIYMIKNEPWFVMSEDNEIIDSPEQHEKPSKSDGYIWKHTKKSYVWKYKEES